MDWAWIYGRVATTLGCLPSAIDEEPAVDILRLLEYWREEPPTHVLLALRYLGERFRKPKSAKQAAEQMGEAAKLLGPGAKTEGVSQQTRDLVAYAEEQLAKMRAAKGKRRRH